MLSGQVMAVLDNSVLQAELNQAKAEVDPGCRAAKTKPWLKRVPQSRS